MTVDPQIYFEIKTMYEPAYCVTFPVPFENIVLLSSKE